MCSLLGWGSRWLSGLARAASILMRSLGLMATKTFMFLFADIEGSAAMGRRPVDAGAGAGYHRLIRAGLAAHGG
jgi:hypothetical protein